MLTHETTTKKSFLIQAQAHVYQATKNGEFCTDSTLLSLGEIFSWGKSSLPHRSPILLAAAYSRIVRQRTLFLCL